MQLITKSEMSSYILGKTLGKGTFGKVKLGMHKVTGEPVAIKILEKSKIKDVTDVERVARQLHILKITQHSSIAQMYEIIETEQNIFIVMQYAPKGEFFDYIMDAKIKNELEAHHYFVQIVSGLEYMHKLKISHRDIKPQNMLLDNHNRLKIVDFGLSNMYKQGQLLLTACGSPCYASPEMIKGQQYDPELTDVWSLGVVLFSMIFAKLPFEDDNTSVLYGKIKSGLYVIDKKISPELRDLLSKLLCVKPKLRLNIQGIKEHPWYKRQKMCKCHGIIVGYQTAPLDDDIIKDMQQLGYDCVQARKFLENNIRNQITTAYYLLLKKRFRIGNPSTFDISNESFNKKSITQKVSRLNLHNAAKGRHQSLDLSSPNSCGNGKETLEVQQYIFSAQKLKKFNNLVKRERNCYSQMKSQDYDGFKTHLKSFEVYKPHQPSIFKKTIRERYEGNNLNKRQSLSRSKKSDGSKKSLNERRKSLNNNISINVYINNAKIETPTKSKLKTNTLLEKELVQNKNNDGFFKSFKLSSKRLKTEVIERERSQNKAANRYQSVKDHNTESKSLQKSHEISILDGMFWKKRSAVKAREHTAQSRQDRQSKLRKW